MSSFDRTLDNTIGNFSGGNPSTLDLVPAIIFTVVTGLTLPLLAWRILSPKHRSKILVNQVLFFLTRLTALILRSYMSRRDYGLSILIAELLLTSISALFLINSVIDLWQKSCEHEHDDSPGADNFGIDAKPKGSRNWVKYVANFLRVVLVASLAALIAAGAILSRQADQENVRNTIRNLLKASYILGLATTVVGLAAAVITHFTQHRSWRQTLLISAYAIPLLVSSIYRVVESFSGYRATSRQIAAFWVAMILFDFIAYSILLAISIPKWFGRLRNHFTHGDPEKRARLDSTDTRRY